MKYPPIKTKRDAIEACDEIDFLADEILEGIPYRDTVYYTGPYKEFKELAKKLKEWIQSLELPEKEAR
jgi:hypothetical protein